MAIMKGEKERRPRIFYGWWVALASLVVKFVGVGISSYSFSVLLVSVLKEFHWPRAQASFAYSLKWWLIGLGSPLAGFVVDRYGGKVCLILGALLMGTSMLLLSRMDALLSWYLLYALAGVGGAMALYVPNYTVVSKRKFSLERSGVGWEES